MAYFNSLKVRNAVFSPAFGGGSGMEDSHIDHFIDILATFPSGEEKEKLIGVFSSWLLHR